MEIRPAVKADVIEMCGPEMKVTVRAYAIEDNGELLAVAGIAYGKRTVCFGDIKQSVKRSPRSILRLARKVTALVDKCKGPVFAFPDENEPTAERFLAHVGFEKLDGGVYVWR